MQHDDATAAGTPLPGDAGLPSLAAFTGRDLGTPAERRPRNRTVHLGPVNPMAARPGPPPPPVGLLPADAARGAAVAEVSPEEAAVIASGERAEAIRTRDPIAALSQVVVSPEGMVGRAETRRVDTARRGFPLGAVLVAGALSLSIVLATIVAGATQPPSAPQPSGRPAACAARC